VINIHYPYTTASSLSRLYRSMPLLLQLPSIYLRPLPYVCPSSSCIQLPEPLKPVTSILVGDNVMNNMSLLFFFDMCLPYAFYFYLSEHEFTCRNTRVTKHMLNMCLPRIYNMLNMLFMHVYITF
jgi:hypothetical protein